MRMVDIIVKKRYGGTLSKKEFAFVISGFLKGEIPDYQVSALLMAICLQGTSEKEAADLTEVMTHSGDVMDLSSIHGVVCDKHSTGGVGDTTTLVLAPLVAACGGKVAKMSGRGLGHTGGTLDKLESIPGFKTEVSTEKFIELVNQNGVAVIGQNDNLVPADKQLYALRDVTGTVESLALIASSVMSKKLAAGAEAIVLDVKVGKGAFMKDLDDAFALAKVMVDIGSRLNRNVVALVTDMNQPLGSAIGNALDVKEAIEVLQGKKQNTPLHELCMILSQYMLVTSQVASSLQEAEKMCKEALDSGKALEKMRHMIEAQGGNSKVCDDFSLLGTADYIEDIIATEEGYVQEIDPVALGMISQTLGAGRSKKDDVIDHSVGLEFYVRLGDTIAKGDRLATIYANDEKKLASAKESFASCIEIGKQKKEKLQLIYGVVTADGEERWQ